MAMSMQDGVALGGLLLAVTGSIYGTRAQQRAAKAAANQLRFQAELSEINRRAAEVEAESVMLAGTREGARATEAYAQLRGRSRADAAAAGQDLDSGSTAEVQASIRMAAEIDRLTIASNTARAAAAVRVGQANLAAEAGLRRAGAVGMATTAATLSPALAGVATALGGASQLADRWAYNRQPQRQQGGGGSILGTWV